MKYEVRHFSALSVRVPASTVLIHVPDACICIPAVLLNNSEQLPVLRHRGLTLQQKSGSVTLGRITLIPTQLPRSGFCSCLHGESQASRPNRWAVYLSARHNKTVAQLRQPMHCLSCDASWTQVCLPGSGDGAGQTHHNHTSETQMGWDHFNTIYSDMYISRRAWNHIRIFHIVSLDPNIRSQPGWLAQRAVWCCWQFMHSDEPANSLSERCSQWRPISYACRSAVVLRKCSRHAGYYTCL